VEHGAGWSRTHPASVCGMVQRWSRYSRHVVSTGGIFPWPSADVPRMWPTRRSLYRCGVGVASSKAPRDTDQARRRDSQSPPTATRHRSSHAPRSAGGPDSGRVTDLDRVEPIWRYSDVSLSAGPAQLRAHSRLSAMMEWRQQSPIGPSPWSPAIRGRGVSGWLLVGDRIAAWSRP